MMSYEELEHAYFKLGSVLGGTRTALQKVKENRDMWRERCEIVMARLKLERLRISGKFWGDE